MLVPVHGKRYLLVVFDHFSRWVEAIPSKDMGAGTVIKFLVREVIPRFGLLSILSSDSGPAFTNKVYEGVLRQLGIKVRHGSIYTPSSQGGVERVNGTLKAKINKICACTGLRWHDALPLALMSYRMQAHRVTHLSPHEMLTGRPMPGPQFRGPFKGPPLEQLEKELHSYMKQLSAIHKAIYFQEKANEPKQVSVTSGPVVPGDKVYIKEFQRRWNTPRRRGPYTVVRATPTAVQVEGSFAWHHLNHCSLATTTNNCKTGPGDWSGCAAFSNDQSPKRGSIASHASDEDSPVRADSELSPDDVVSEVPVVSSVVRDSNLGRDNSTNPDPQQQLLRRPITRAFSRKQRGNCATRERPQ
ncbi:uncharacterized protein LOC121637533 [Melanotaenia boesemani]|uniref:uncharacterized protein LOC121637533 n=1 Tax=Melanotaenia boesemani TaxID=1250792 RepID=UPI001C0448E2|nr:uncharacterized protein LOC121637533 [Melanotaenia boesemani]